MISFLIYSQLDSTSRDRTFLANQVDALIKGAPEPPSGWGPWKWASTAHNRATLEPWPATTSAQLAVLEETARRDAKGRTWDIRGAEITLYKENLEHTDSVSPRWSLRVRLGERTGVSAPNSCALTVVSPKDRVEELSDFASRTFDYFVRFWSPRHAALRDRSLARLSMELTPFEKFPDPPEVGWRTYISDETARQWGFEEGSLPSYVHRTRTHDGIFLTLDGTLSDPDVTGFMAVRRALHLPVPDDDPHHPRLRDHDTSERERPRRDDGTGGQDSTTVNL